jgi:FKBP-type peptidyl-prolyl cis-trans isomerase
VVSWAADVSLTDGSVRMSATATKPLMMAIGLTDLPASFHDLAAMTIPGDSVEAWIPAAEAWGLSGKPPVIPQDAVIHLRFKVLSVETPEST